REEVISALHSNGIYTLEVQGTVVKKYYPQSHLRMMSDIDFIIPVEKLDDAKLVMQSIGYTADNPYGIGIDASKNMINIELHTRFFTTQDADLNPMNFPYSFAVCGENFTATVTDTIFYLYHLMHTIKHLKYQGLGIRRIVDLYYLENALKDKVDYDYIDSFLKEYGLYDNKLQLLAVKDYWFYGIKPKADISEIQKYILESGTHGTLENYYKNMFLKERAKGKHFVKIRYLLEFLFPKKEYLYNAFPVCKKYHLPVVVCWFYRGIRIFKPEKFKSFKFVLSNLKIKIKRSK
ncbi:MAG: nucleotidyltransferase family protein, partial [Methanocorpusculum sp.]|nr:nucleotidyltransferase family protein [Methanocorpusculum sp.]